MNVLEVAKEDNDLGRFLNFLDKARENKEIRYDIEDWDHMCGIMVFDRLKQEICFNFWADGSFRCLVK